MSSVMRKPYSPLKCLEYHGHSADSQSPSTQIIILDIFMKNFQQRLEPNYLQSQHLNLAIRHRDQVNIGSTVFLTETELLHPQ